ncbi:MAG: TAT-variant-translocated molybdopterin oxidoreductase [Pyrinomonadaceae bacterium]|nr:TAT-variant-translocated molybdopterin oxidoreductase [Pyrinomonadaceae bacterium]
MGSKDSKANFALLKNRILQEEGRDYWRSVEEFIDAPEFEEFVKREYPSHAEEWDSSLSRRNFLKVMGASLAFAGLSGCVIQPAEKIIPYVNTPDGMTPGKPQYFATSMTVGGIATGLLARSNEGRPTKLEGNPDHPGSLGATDVLAQTSILDLYDPDRSQEISNRGIAKGWQTFSREIRTKIDENRDNGGAGIRFLTGTVVSPSLADQFKRLSEELPNAKLVQYEPVNNDNALAGAKMAFGSPAQAVYKFDKAERILSLDADIFSDPNVRYIKDFSKARSISKDKTEMNRLYSVETTMSLTGAKADHRIAVKPSQMPEIAKAIAKALGVSGAESTYSENAKWIEEMAKDLKANDGKSLVVAGNNQPPIVHALAHAMNDALGASGETVVYVEPFGPNAETLQKDQLAELIKDIDAGTVKMLVVMGANPVYNTPVDLKLNADRMAKIETTVHVGEHFDETAFVSKWHVAGKHYLESWGDSRAYDGTATLVQPLVKPLYGGKSISEVVQQFFKENFDKKDLDIVKEYWQKQNFTVTPAVAATQEETDTEPVKKALADTEATPAATPANGAAAPKTFEDKWRKVVHDGFIAGTEASPKSVSVNTGFLSETEEAGSTGSGDLEISILPDPCVYDGRYANNGWLQELPNPLNKVTWENVALVSPNTAQKLGLNQDKRYNDFAGGEIGRAFVTTKGGNMESDFVEVTYADGKIEKSAPVWITPGQPDDVVTIFMGYGRTRAGKVGSNIGYNAFDAQKSDAMWFGKGSIAKTGYVAQVASTQIHFNMEGRDLLRYWGKEEFEKKSKEKPHPPEEVYDLSMYGNAHEDVYKEHQRWGMTIDLNSCVGCNACVVACQSENNIPVVGKEQVERSREMHWMRIDAYYKGDMNDANDIEGPNFQPVTCQQCEQAPCEVVCPVHATVHSAEGLNDMVYNRCIGTRYCSNNCPYKVRRFNFMLYQDWDTPQYKLMRNPEVTVRSRGVMEKCTYCTQRISAARIEAQKEDRDVRDGEIVTACQAACPSDAIVFGDISQKDSKVGKLKKDHRNYALLNHELNTQPRTSYLAGIRNQNKAMPDYIAPEKGDGEHKEDSADAAAH